MHRVGKYCTVVVVTSTTTQSQTSPMVAPTAEHLDENSFPPVTRAYLEVAQEVRERGYLRRAYGFYGTLGIGLLLGLALLAGAFFWLGDTWWQLAVAGVAAILLTQVAFICHELAHRQVFEAGPVNDKWALWLTCGVVGMSYSWWDSKHSRHHANPNRHSKDPDIHSSVVSFTWDQAVEARGIKRAISKRQGWLLFPLLTLEGLNLHWQSLQYLTARGKVKRRWAELGLILGRFVIYLVPLFLVLPMSKAFAFLGVQMAIFGVYMGASFAPNHKGMPIIDKRAKLDFFSKQVRTSRNISGGWWATSLLGGLNYQVEHHLFPSMPRPYLAKARKLVRAQCARLNVPYTETTLWASYGIVIRYLNQVGLGARDPFSCPLMADLRRV